MQDDRSKTREGLAADLVAVEGLCSESRVSLRAIEKILGGRGFASLALLLSLPFVQPIPLPGVSILLGLVLIAIGMRITLGQKGGLPEWIRRREIDSKTLVRIIQAARKVLSHADRLFRPRLTFTVERPYSSLIGWSTMMSGLALLLPLPPVVLFSNSLPAWAVICLSVGFIERDGLMVILGHIIACVTWIYFLILWKVLHLGLDALRESSWYGRFLSQIHQYFSA